VSFILECPPFATLVQLADRIFIIAKGVLFVRIIDKSLLLNHSPSEWFSLYNKKPETFLFQVSGGKMGIRTPERF
jgi:hypothetical protein